MSYLLLVLLLAQDQPTFRSGVALVHVDAEVSQGNRIVADLGKESFRVAENGKPQTILYFGHQEEPLDVVLLFDARTEMRPVVQRVAEAAHKALSDLQPGDRVAVMTFGITRDCKTDLISGFTSDFEVGERSIGSALQPAWTRTNGCSILRGFRSAARHFLDQPNGHHRRAIVIITDDKGAPYRSDAVRDTVRDLWNADAVVLCVIVHSGAVVIYIAPPYRGARYIAAQTGGDTLNTPDAAEGLHEMIHRLRSRYSLYYALPPGRAGEERKIRVQLVSSAARRYPRAVIRARTGYVAP